MKGQNGSRASKSHCTLKTQSAPLRCACMQSHLVLTHFSYTPSPSFNRFTVCRALSLVVVISLSFAYLPLLPFSFPFLLSIRRHVVIVLIPFRAVLLR